MTRAGERKLVQGKKSERRKINNDPNLTAGKRSDNALDHKPKPPRRAEPLVIEKTP